MTWSYTNAPSTSQRDEIRFLAGDNVSGAKVTLSDEEIAYLLAQAGTSVGAAIMACEALAAGWNAQPESQSTGGISVSRGAMASKFYARAASLRARRLSPVPYLGGMSISDKETDQTDSDMTGPRFFRGMGDNPEAGDYEPESES